jgi:hypothetical protein
LSRKRVVPIVEGHGEWASVRTLLQRVWTELLGGDYLEVLQPIRTSRGKLLQPKELDRRIRLAALKLGAVEEGHRGFVLLLLDADEDLPCELAPRLLRDMRESRADLDVACVLAHPEYETWFVAAAESLGGFLDLRADELLPTTPEKEGLKKAWIEQRFLGTRYSETVDQPRMTAAMDLALCRSRSPSFDKLCRELEARKE